MVNTLLAAESLQRALHLDLFASERAGGISRSAKVGIMDDVLLGWETSKVLASRFEFSVTRDETRNQRHARQDSRCIISSSSIVTEARVDVLDEHSAGELLSPHWH